MRYASPSGPMCLMCLMLTLSGPVELLFLLCFIAAWTCVVVSVMLVNCSLSVLCPDVVSELYFVCVLPFGMLCMSAWRVMFVKMVFAVCISGSG